MNNTLLSIISLIAIFGLIIISLIIIKKRVTKLGKTILWFFLPVYVISFILYFCAIITTENDLPLHIKIAQTIVVAFKSFALDLNLSIVEKMIKGNVIYGIALCFLWLIASFNTLYIIILAFITTFKDTLKSLFIKRKPHNIILVDDLTKLNAINNLKQKSIVILNDELNLKTESRKYASDNFCFVYTNNLEQGLKKAGILTKKATVISLINDDDKNLKIIISLNKLLPKFNKGYVNCNSYGLTKLINAEKNINIFSSDDLVAREFIFRYPLFEIATSCIDEKLALLVKPNIKHFFLGYSGCTKQLINNIIANYQSANDRIKIYILDKFARKHFDEFTSTNYVNEYIKEVMEDPTLKAEYFDLADGRYDIATKDIDNNSYELKKYISENQGDFNLYYIDYEDDLTNFEKAIELKEFCDGINLSNFQIYTKISSNNEFLLNELKNKNILVYGENKKIISDSIMIEQSLDDIAKKINYFYASKYSKDQESEEVEWMKLDLFTKNSNRFASMNIVAKLNLLGLTLTTKENEKTVSEDEYYQIYCESNLTNYFDMTNYQYENKRINLGIVEHYRWNAFQIMNNIYPMKKEMIFKDGKYNRKNNAKRQHSNILSLDGIFELENFLKSWDKLSEDEKIEYSKIFIKDFDLMDHLFEVIKDTNYKVVKIKEKNK